MMEKYNTTTTATSTMHPFTLASHDDVNQHVTSLDGEPAFPITPVLSLELENISKMSKGGREGLSYMWSVFSRCKESIRDGRRLENLSWRLWYEDLKSTGCVSHSTPTSTADLSDPESDSEDSGDERNTFADIEKNDDAARQGESAENDEQLEAAAAAAANSSNLSYLDTTATYQPLKSGERRDLPLSSHNVSDGDLSRGRARQAQHQKGSESQAVAGETGKVGPSKGPASEAVHFSTSVATSTVGATVAESSSVKTSTGTAFDKEATLSSPQPCQLASPSSAQAAPSTITSPSLSTSSSNTTKDILNLPPSSSSSSSSSPSKQHIRRSSCPASRSRDMLRVSKIDGDQSSKGQNENTQMEHTGMTKKEKRALSFANAHRPTRIARAMPPLTPETIQDIIGAVLPMDFKRSPRIRLSSATPSVTSPPPVTSSTDPIVSSNVITPPTRSTPPVTASAAPRKSASPVRPTKIEHTREPSIKSERSYFTSTTATSDFGVDPVFSPPLESPVKQDGDHQQELAHLVPQPSTTSAPTQPTASTSQIPYSSPQLTQSEDTRDIKSPSPDSIAEEDEGESQQKTQEGEARVTSASTAPSMKRNSSSHRMVAVKPALLTRGGKNSASSSKLNKSALQRTQSAKSVRILESPTEADGAALEGSSAEHAAAVATTSTAAAAAPSTANYTHHGKHTAKHPHVAPKRTLSSTKLKGHVRNGSSVSLHREARTKSPPPVREEKKTASPIAAVVSAQMPAAQLQPPIQAPVERPEMQAAPHVTKAINIRRNNSSLANIIKTEPRSVSRGFAIPGGGGAEEGTRTSSPASPSTTAAANAVVAQSAPDAPALHPPPPSPASPVIMVPSSVILPPQPRPSPADPRFRVHSTIRRPASPPLGEELESESESNVNVSPKQRTRTPKRSATSTLPASDVTTTAPRDMRPEPQQLTNAKKKQMFFFSSPGTDSDDEHSTSLKRVAMNAAMTAAPPPSKANSPTKEGRIASEKEKSSAKPAIKVVQVTTPTEEKTQNRRDGSNHTDDDEYEDEDDSDWSSEASESEEDEHQAAIRREEERQRLMFAKRTPSMVATQGGLLSKMLRPEEYSRGFANMPDHLRDNKSVMHLNQLPNIGGTAGIERARATNALLTVTGLQASKSTAALPDLKAAETSRLVPTKSGNHLTRLGGAPSGVELESDDDEDDEPVQEISPTQQKKLAALMQRTTSSNGRPRTSGGTQHSPPRAEVTRVTSAAQIAMQPEVQPANIFTPRTTRRNMLATELTESLRASLLAERNKSRPAAGLGRIVSAVGSRFGVRPQSDSAPSQIEQPAIPPPPRIQRGSTGFTPANQVSNGAERARPGPTRASTARLPSTRANSDPPQQTADYYSPGFHHTGW